MAIRHRADFSYQSHRGSSTGLLSQSVPSSGRPFMVVDARGVSNARSLLGAFSHYVPTPTLDMTMEHMVEYIMDAKVVAHAMQADAYVVRLQVPVDDAEANDYDADDDMDAPEDPPIIDISNDDEDEDMEPEPESGDWIEDADNLDDDPEEILYDDGDWDTDSDASSVITI
ncbi:hypothetical protein TIFTF001_047839 [Ficus carica]|uniref:Uncharacterized protein n=1 Tax=Ficus carica TaxID=3494 RepID=A0AA87ZMR1_FICCA|nr:hypothetical protein TIFTF001_047839 [Ficus carica]